MRQDPRTFYETTIRDNNALKQSLQALVFRLSWARILFFLLFVIIVVYFANARNTMVVGTAVLLFPLGFGLLVRAYNRMSEKLRFISAIIDLSSAELSRMSLELKNFDGGAEFTDREHPYSYDLDLFGSHSLFALLNRTRNPAGRIKLAEWMLSPASPDQIAYRQEAVAELSTMPEWMLRFFAAGHEANPDIQQTENLLNWLKEDEQPKFISAMRVAGFILPVIFLGLLAGIIISGWSVYALAPSVIINGLLLTRIQGRIKKVAEQTWGNVRLLRSYTHMIEELRDARFESPRLQALQQPFLAHSIEAIRSLRRLLDYLDGRSNLFYGILNLIFMFDYHLLISLSRWKTKHKVDLALWFDNIAEVECLSSLGGHSFIHPGHHRPEICEGWQIEAVQIGHPLIPPEECVANDFTLSGEGMVMLITGSNMSGKSTFLRTVGINSVLALMGSVVCARAMKLPVLQLFTGMRSEDDLSSHISSFYAELRRIRSLLDLIHTSELPVLYLLDEILKGTNTKDRHRGSEGLVTQLSSSASFGLVSTHDLEIGKLSESNPAIVNYSFNSTITGNEIHFDYKLTEGICRSFNASVLMEKMGIRLSD